MRSKAYLFIFLLPIILGCTQPDSGLADPAVYCEEHGFTYDIRDEPGGQTGYCVSDYGECDGWAYYSGECELWGIEGRTDHRYGIFIMDADGTNVRQIHGSDTPLSFAVPSPDGTRIAFGEYSGSLEQMDTSEIFIVNMDGTNYRQLTDNSWMDFQPKWSPDGDELLFISNPENVGTDIYVMDTNGNITRQLTDTPGISEADPDWKCGLITYTRNYSVWVMNDDGSNQHAVTDPPRKGSDVGIQFPIGDYDPNLSPDCSRIVFSRLMNSGLELGGTKIGDYDLYIYNVTSQRSLEISNDDGADMVPKWNAAGDKILFVYLTDITADVYDIFTISPDGSSRTKVTGNDPIEFIENGCAWLGNQIIFTAEFYE